MAGQMTRLKLYNAPAGSGKTTSIQNIVNEWAIENKELKMLCITFTNRAAAELSNGIDRQNVDISTIHSFVAGLCKPHFKNPEVVKLYFKEYADAIDAKLKEINSNPEKLESRKYYEEKYGTPLTLELIKSNVEELRYTETKFNHLLSGGLSHNDLLEFLKQSAEKFPLIRQKVAAKYNQIIIDEYQDTHIDILELFVGIAKDPEFDTELSIYGDRMQQIFAKPNPNLNDLLNEFENSTKEVINFRSTDPIVKMLNKLYNDEDLIQATHLLHGAAHKAPVLHLVDNVEEALNKLDKTEALQLWLTNKKVYQKIQAEDLWQALGAHPQYSYRSQVTPKDLLNEAQWNLIQDNLVRACYALLQLKKTFDLGYFGELIKILRENPNDFLSPELSSHQDKALLHSKLKEHFLFLEKDSTSIHDALENAVQAQIVSFDRFHTLKADESYQNILQVPFVQVRRCFELAQDPAFSTQHGVKGESHDEVILIPDNSPNLNISMSLLFKLWGSKTTSVTEIVNLQNLETAFFEVASLLERITEEIGMRVKDLNRESFKLAKDSLQKFAEEFNGLLQNSPVLSELYAEKLNKFQTSPILKNAKYLFEVNIIARTLGAYKLFYVGCSRARFALDVVVDRNLLREVNVESFTKKFREFGFEISQ